MLASELKIGDTFRKDGFLFTVKEIENESYKNGKPSLLVSCSLGNSSIVDSYFHFKPTTKIK